MAPQNAVLKDGVMFQSMHNGIDLGPGYYYTDTKTLEKKSHNIRATRSSVERNSVVGSRGVSPAASPMGKQGSAAAMSPSFEWSPNQRSPVSGRQSGTLKRAQSAPRLRRGGPGSGSSPNFGFETPIAQDYRR
jgi:hypothetical protein